MFKRTCKAMLKEENYIEALAFYCGKMDQIFYYEQIEDYIHKTMSILWNIAEKADNEEYEEQANKIYSALLMLLSVYRKG